MNRSFKCFCGALFIIAVSLFLSSCSRKGDDPVDSPQTQIEAVDLGLSVKWASFNVGAAKPEDYGDYYAWGETDTKSNYSWSTYKFGKSSSGPISKYNTQSSYGTVDNKTVFDLEDDVAQVKLGGKWRIPTDAEWTELREQCTWTWTDNYNGTGVAGRIVTSKKAGYTDKSIFLPAAGDRDDTRLDDAGSYGTCWSSSLSTVYPGSAYYVFFYSDDVLRGYDYRYVGFSVRPVYGDFISVSSVNLNQTSLSLTVGNSAVLTASVNPSNASDRTVFWTSSNTNVATVSHGTVTALSAGTATITASAGGKSATCTVTVTQPGGGVPEAVDLGLSVKWASFNVGAAKPEEFGDYFAWGETKAKSTYSWETYKFRTSGNQWDNVKFSKYNAHSFYGTVDNKTVLDPEDDVAHVNLGGKWRMPTDAEWTELREQCTWTWTDNYKGTGIAGRIVTSNKTGYTDKSIFLPAASYRDDTNLGDAGSYGDYWSSSLLTDNPRGAWGVSFGSGDVSRYSFERYYGFSVRPVSE